MKLLIQVWAKHNNIFDVSWCSYSTIAWGASVDKGVQDNVEYGYKAKSTAGTVFNFFSALGEVAFAYAGHNVVLEIQATIPSTPEKPSKGPMWRGVIVAYIVVALCYFPVALIGYWMFGNAVSDNILISLENPAWLIAMANMFVVIHVIGSYQVLFQTPLIQSSQIFPPTHGFVCLHADLCYASVWYDRNCLGKETAFQTQHYPSVHLSEHICW